MYPTLVWCLLFVESRQYVMFCLMKWAWKHLKFIMVHIIGKAFNCGSVLSIRPLLLLKMKLGLLFNHIVEFGLWWYLLSWYTLCWFGTL